MFYISKPLLLSLDPRQTNCTPHIHSHWELLVSSSWYLYFKENPTGCHQSCISPLSSHGVQSGLFCCLCCFSLSGNYLLCYLILGNCQIQKLLWPSMAISFKVLVENKNKSNFLTQAQRSGIYLDLSPPHHTPVLTECHGFRFCLQSLLISISLDLNMKLPSPCLTSIAWG